MSITKNFELNVLYDEALAFTYTMYVFYEEHLDHCSIEDRDLIQGPLQAVKELIINRKDHEVLQNPIDFEECMNNTFSLMFDDWRDFMNEYNIWAESRAKVDISKIIGTTLDNNICEFVLSN